MIIGNVNEFLSYDLFKRSEKYAEKFQKGKRVNGRSFDRIFKDTLYGEISELAVARFFNGKQVPFSIAYYDVETERGEKIEVKHTRRITKYWEFYKNQYDFFFQNAHKIDKIVLVQIFPNGDLNLKYIANAKTFEEYVREYLQN